MIGGVITWGLYSSFLKKKKFTLPLLTLVHILCTLGLLFILPQFLFELSQGQIIKFDVNLGFILDLSCFISKYWLLLLLGWSCCQ